MDELTTILYIGDIIGKPGRRAVKSMLGELTEDSGAELVIANGENSAGGFGITPDVYQELIGLGIDVVTSGNHVWDKREILDYMDMAPRLLRPANYPHEDPGKGSEVYECQSGAKVGVLNLSGRVFMDAIDCPFKTAERHLERLLNETKLVFVDFHGEATSEKNAMGHFLDGRVGAIIGSHTHVQTADERVLPGGSAFITDAGMTGPTDSVIGIDKDIIIKKFLTQMPARYELARGGVELQGVVVRLNVSGQAVSIERVKKKAA